MASTWIGRTPLRWLMLITYLIVLAVTLTALGVGLYCLLGRFLWFSNTTRLRSNVEAAWYEDDGEQIDHPRGMRGLAAPSGFPRDAGALARRLSGFRSFGRVLDLNGGVLAEVPSRRALPGVRPAQVAALRTNLDPHPMQVYLDRAADGGEWQVLLMPIRRERSSSDEPLIGIVQIGASYHPTREVLRALAGYFVFGAVLAGLLALAATSQVAARLARPLEQLEGAAIRVRAGDLAARSGFATGGSNEIYAVAQAFDAMVEQLQQSFESQRRFVADASHELKTPLTAIGGMAELLLVGADQGQPETRQLALKTIEKEVDRMGALVADLLTLSRAEQKAAEPVRVDLAQLVREACEETRLLWPDRPIDLQLPEHALNVLGQREQLERVLRNLLDNAVHYSAPGSPLEVRAEAGGSTVRVSIGDLGVGISAHDLPKIFDRFYRADSSRSRKTGGSGLGLAIVKALVEQHGGQIGCDSQLGVGSTFRLSFPEATA